MNKDIEIERERFFCKQLGRVENKIIQGVERGKRGFGEK